MTGQDEVGSHCNGLGQPLRQIIARAMLGGTLRRASWNRQVEWLPRRDSAVLGWQGGGEEVDEQLCDALMLVVMHPVRRVGQALDAI